MDPGKLRYIITLQQQGSGQDAIGQPLDEWSTVATVWADIRYLQGLEVIRADASQSKAKASIRIRWRSDVHAGMRVMHEAQLFNITAVLPGNTRQFVDLACEVTT